MRRALSLFAAAAVMLVSADAMCDAGTTPVDAGNDGSTDSGVGTKPSPNNPTVSPDSGTTTASDAGAGGGGADSGCSFTAQRSEGGSTLVGLFAGVSMLVMSRRRRTKR